jgi:tRNA threonylcarbamoyladenosine biosynthesis protein TsaE
MNEFVTRSAAETQALAARLAAAVRPPQVIALRGNLGAGKTTFVQGLAQGLCVRSRVASPTFVLINEYSGRDGVRLIHADTYRLGAAAGAEAEMLGLDDLFADATAVVAIEWADRVADLLPPDHLLVELDYGEDADMRVVKISALGPRSAAVLAEIGF